MFLAQAVLGGQRGQKHLVAAKAMWDKVANQSWTEQSAERVVQHVSPKGAVPSSGDIHVPVDVPRPEDVLAVTTV